MIFGRFQLLPFVLLPPNISNINYFAARTVAIALNETWKISSVCIRSGKKKKRLISSNIERDSIQ
jgi:hypothetical protein